MQSLVSPHIVKVFGLELVKVGKKEYYLIEMEKCDCNKLIFIKF